MIDIESAIMQSKNMENVSDGGSACFDFDDVVLVKYICETKYLKNGEHVREKEEEIMAAINKKANDGVNTPKHLAIKRLVEDKYDICYVLQDKCPGFNCASKSKYGVSFDEMCESLTFISNIPFEHYKKLIDDGCKIFEMGYEQKNKNLFYDENSGFWYIDFLSNDKSYTFDDKDIKKVFEALKYIIPKPIQMASDVKYGEILTNEQKKKANILRNSIKQKTFLAIKSVLPDFQKYEKFFLLEEENDYKLSLMEEGIVNKDLINIEESDYEVFNELYEIVMNGLIEKIEDKGEKFWSIEANDVRNDSQLFNLQSFFEKSKYNSLKCEDFDDEYDYRYEVDNMYKNFVMTDLIKRLDKMNKNENIIDFLSDANKKLNLNQNSNSSGSK